jgi:LPXTG-motif cell wall-anchored protein
MSGVLVATGQTTVWSWLALAGLLIALGLGGYGLIRVNRRQRRAIAAARAKVDRVPPELRFQPEPLWLRVGVLLAAFVVATTARLAVGPAAGIVALFLILVPAYVRVHRKRRHDQQEVITTVRARASSMDRAALSELVEGLEATHGRYEMRPLRELLPDLPAERTEPRAR